MNFSVDIFVHYFKSLRCYFPINFVIHGPKGWSGEKKPKPSKVTNTNYGVQQLHLEQKQWCYNHTVNYTQTNWQVEYFNCLSVINCIIMNFYQTNEPLQELNTLASLCRKSKVTNTANPGTMSIIKVKLVILPSCSESEVTNISN